MKELDKQLLLKLDGLMNKIEKSKDVKLIKQAAEFSEAFQAYLKDICKILKLIGGVGANIEDFQKGGWDTVWKNE